ncbi:MFS transporter [Deinococcus aetherius]|uniref:MFS transporter n=1 Tax=Deinococcus aetherius TaxID=200252 RepID=A0ABN6REQ3_9DEIO|nr:MFS transporter [Deinococcus aetherius]BDP41821.1 MFS transporter [Deinococcus aetherius]
MPTPLTLLGRAEGWSALGEQVYLLALPLTAAQVLHASPAQVGLLVTAELLPVVLLSLPLGTWLEECSHRRVLVWGSALRGAVLAALPLAPLLGGLRLEGLYLVSFALGTLGLACTLARQSLLPDVVPPSALTEANGRLEVVRSGVEVVGPGVAGGLVTALGAPLALLGGVAAFLGSAVALGGLPEEPHRTRGMTRPAWQETREGLAFVWNHGLLQCHVLTAATLNLARGAFEAVFVLYLAREIGLGVISIGVVFTVGNVGFLVGAWAARSGTRLGTVLPATTPPAVLAPLLAGAGLLGVPLVGGLGGGNLIAVPLFALTLAVQGVGVVVWGIQHVSLRQALTPPALQSRVHASAGFLAGLPLPLGAWLGGLTAEHFGTSAALWGIGVTGLGACGWLLPAVGRARCRHLRGEAEG